MVDDGRHSSEEGNTPPQLRHPQPYPQRITLDLTVDDHHALVGARYADRVPMADRLRALISLWREDPALAEAVSTRAQELLLATNPTPAATPPPTPSAIPPTATVDPQAPPAS